MTFVENVPEAEASGAVADMYEADVQALGPLPNFPKALSVLSEKFLAPEAVRDLVQNYQTAGLEPVDLAVMDLADKVAHDATTVTQADVDRLRTLGLTDSEILDVVLAAAARCFFSKTLDGVGAEPDSKYSELDPDLRDALTVGRPIARR